MKPTDVEAAAFGRGGLLVEAIPVAAAYAVQIFHPTRFVEIIRQVYIRVSLLFAESLYLWGFRETPTNVGLCRRLEFEDSSLPLFGAHRRLGTAFSRLLLAAKTLFS